MAAEPRARLIAHYLPQFHPIPENDAWWGPGFTEWTNVAKARPLFPGHKQPQLPGELGFYDLRLPETREAQSQLALDHGVEGFCYWHYWFGGKRLLERPFTEVLASGRPRVPFCLGWANETWTGIWHGAANRVLIEQTYPGPEDEARHFAFVRQAFVDDRYIRVHGKPLFFVYKPHLIPEPLRFVEHWQKLARESGLPGIYFVAQTYSTTESWPAAANGFDAVVYHNLAATTYRILHDARGTMDHYLRRVSGKSRREWRNLLKSGPDVVAYTEFSRRVFEGFGRTPLEFPSVVPNWDNTPRSGTRGYLLSGATPELFRQHLEDAILLVKHRTFDERIIFVKSWNEWAEGNYIEPCREFGRGYLEACRDAVS